MPKDGAEMGTDGGASGGWPPWNHKSRNGDGASGGMIVDEADEGGGDESVDDGSGEGLTIHPRSWAKLECNGGLSSLSAVHWRQIGSHQGGIHAGGDCERKMLMMPKSLPRATTSKNWAKQSQGLPSWGGGARSAEDDGYPSGP